MCFPPPRKQSDIGIWRRQMPRRSRTFSHLAGVRCCRSWRAGQGWKNYRANCLQVINDSTSTCSPLPDTSPPGHLELSAGHMERERRRQVSNHQGPVDTLTETPKSLNPQVLNSLLSVRNTNVVSPQCPPPAHASPNCGEITATVKVATLTQRLQRLKGSGSNCFTAHHQ